MPFERLVTEIRAEQLFGNQGVAAQVVHEATPARSSVLKIAAWPRVAGWPHEAGSTNDARCRGGAGAPADDLSAAVGDRAYRANAALRALLGT